MKDEIRDLLDKAAESVDAGRILLAADHPGFAVGRGYYAMFYAAEALLASKGLRFRKHAGVHAALGEHFSKTGILNPKYHRWLLEAFAARIQGDYAVDVRISSDDACTVLSRAEEFLGATRKSLDTMESG